MGLDITHVAKVKKKNVAPQFSLSALEKLVLKERLEAFFLGGLLRVLEIARVRRALVTSPARAAARRGRCGVGASQLRSHWLWEKHGRESSSCSFYTHSRVNRTCSHTKGKCLHCLHCFLSFERRGETARIGTGQWKSLPGLCRSPEQGREGGPCSFTLPRTPPSRLARGRVSCTWVNQSAGDSPTLF